MLIVALHVTKKVVHLFSFKVKKVIIEFSTYYADLKKNNDGSIYSSPFKKIQIKHFEIATTIPNNSKFQS